MTNQEVNQVYWCLPQHCRDTLDVLLAEGLGSTAAYVIQDFTKLHRSRQGDVITNSESLEWAKWRVWLDGGTRQD